MFRTRPKTPSPCRPSPSPYTPLLSGADMTLASLSAWLPLPYPDASAETLKKLFSDHATSSPRGGSRDARGEALTPLYSSAQSMVSLGPVARRRRGFSHRGRGQAAAAGAGADARVFSRKTVWRGFTAPRDHQLEALEQVLWYISFCVSLTSIALPA